jgi:hypothetical protein
VKIIKNPLFWSGTKNQVGSIREFPDRFLLGTDPCCGLDHLYDEMISELRLYFLANLPKEIAEKIAYKNIIELLGLKN